jgi:hypothetical protein
MHPMEDTLTPNSITGAFAPKLPIRNKASKLKDGLHNNNNSSGAGLAIAKAIGDFTNILSTTLQQWNDRQAYENANPDLKKRYDELLIMEKVHQMEEAQRRRKELQ